MYLSLKCVDNYQVFFLSACWFDLRLPDRCVWIPGVSKAKSMRADSHTNARDLTGALLKLLFTPM